jgi:hypothetical protein
MLELSSIGIESRDDGRIGVGALTLQNPLVRGELCERGREFTKDEAEHRVSMTSQQRNEILTS